MAYRLSYEEAYNDYLEAMRWYKLAASSGDADAQISIGNLYYFGNGVEVDYREAMRWYELARDKLPAKSSVAMPMREMTCEYNEATLKLKSF